MTYRGTIIEESLEDGALLKSLTILDTRVEPVTERHKTPWLQQWTLHTVEIPGEHADAIAEQLSHSIDSTQPGSWYIDFKNDQAHYIIFRDKIFRLNRSRPEEYEEVKRYGMERGIPQYQLDFSPDIE